MRKHLKTCKPGLVLNLANLGFSIYSRCLLSLETFPPNALREEHIHSEVVIFAKNCYLHAIKMKNKSSSVINFISL